MERCLEYVISEDLKEKMVFLGGPRQIGKTTLALNLLEGGSENHPAYLSWDVVASRKALLQGALPGDESLVILDEIHKYKGWRNLVKGLYDSNRSRRRFLITGSARLDHYRRGGDSLQGRYHYHRLHPLSLYEANDSPTRSDLDHLLRFGGFPEPFLKGNTRHWKRWQRERQSRVIQDDLFSLEHVKEVSQLDLLAQILPDRVGSPLSINKWKESSTCGTGRCAKTRRRGSRTWFPHICSSTVTHGRIPKGIAWNCALCGTLREGNWTSSSLRTTSRPLRWSARPGSRG